MPLLPSPRISAASVLQNYAVLVGLDIDRCQGLTVSLPMPSEGSARFQEPVTLQFTYIQGPHIAGGVPATMPSAVESAHAVAPFRFIEIISQMKVRRTRSLACNHRQRHLSVPTQWTREGGRRSHHGLRVTSL